MIDHPGSRHADRGPGARTGIRCRDFVAGSALAGAAWMTGAKAWAQIAPLHCVPPLPSIQAVLFNPPTGGPVRMRKSVFDLSVTEVTRLKAAYAALRSTYREDPRSWYNQGLVHCWYCSGALDSLNGMEIHGGWWFLGWHRAYLYFHERILGDLIGDPTFALPYWDWDSCTDDPNDMNGRNRFPGEVYGFPGDSRFRSTIQPGPRDRTIGSPPIYVGPTLMKPIITASHFAEFGGSGNQELPSATPAEGDAQQMGQLEVTPHGLVHVWTTDPTLTSDRGLPNMGALASAGFDPVFFAHHANIDRLWDFWNQDTTHANPSNPRWLVTQPFLFYDQLQTWTGIFNTQMTSTDTLLSYRYQPPNWPAAAPPAAPAPTGRARCAARSSDGAAERSAGGAQHRLGTQGPPAPAYDGPGSGTGAGEGEDNGAGRPGESPEPCPAHRRGRISCRSAGGGPGLRQSARHYRGGARAGARIRGQHRGRAVDRFRRPSRTQNRPTEFRICTHTGNCGLARDPEQYFSHAGAGDR